MTYLESSEQQDASRGSGRTLAMVRSLPSTGSVVVVHNSGLREYVKRMILDVRGAEVAEATTVAICRQGNWAQAALFGRTVPVIIDHAFYVNAPEHVVLMVCEMARGCNAYAGYDPGIEQKAYTAAGREKHKPYWECPNREARW